VSASPVSFIFKEGQGTKDMKSEITNDSQPYSSRRHEHALVIGSSMAGMLAARVLADHFASVTVLERDPYAPGIEHRRGVPQSHHVHALLARGLEIIEELFPGIREELVAAGAQVLDTGSDVAWHTPMGWGKCFKSNQTFLSFSRSFLDKHIRRRLLAIENVRIISGCEVISLVPSSDGKSVNGASVKFHNEAGAIVEPGPLGKFINAELVVDASGRHSHAPDWLQLLGFAPPRETIVNAFLGYATRIYEKPEIQEETCKAIFLQAAPPERRRAGLLFPIENNRWIVTLCGGDRDYPPSEDHKFVDFAESLPSSMLSEAIRDATPLTSIRSFRNTQNRMRHYEEIGDLPGNFVLLGDSVCAFNPVYGQGMTIAAMGALALKQCIAKSAGGSLGTDFVETFQRKLAKLNQLPWALATGEDCRYKGTEGASRTLKARLSHAYIDRIVALTTVDTSVRRLWLRVFQMQEPPSSLFRLGVLLKALLVQLPKPEQKKTATKFVVSRPSWANTSRD
jgi:2-polyprenyl-6-methoxyphenol hydroxylase-like FAD-dependent oxidoreductase